MRIPANINTSDSDRNLVRAILAANAVAIAMPAVPAIVAKPAVTAAAAHPAYPARVAVAAAANTAGKIAGELYLDSPAYPAGIAIPAIPAKAATPARTAAPAISARAAVPAVTGAKGFGGAFRIIATATGCDLVAELPYSSKKYAETAVIRDSLGTVPGLDTASPAILYTNEDPVTYTGTATTLEQYIYDEMLASNGSVSFGFDSLNNRAFVLCKKSSESTIDQLTSFSSGGAV